MSRAVEGTFVPDTWDWNNYQRKAERVDVTERAGIRSAKRAMSMGDIPRAIRILQGTADFCDEIRSEPRPGTPEWIKAQEEVHHD